MFRSPRGPLRLLLAIAAWSAVVLVGTGSLPAGFGRQPEVVRASVVQTATHLVVSEVMTGGESASDEFIEIYNPTGGTLPLAGIELVYVSASGATISRRAAWESGSVPPYAHLLVANESGIFATVADARYSSGMSGSGGSVALRGSGEETAIDAVGWGSAANDWMEGNAADAPASGSSIERLPGGDAGSGFDSGDNATDFVERTDPEPQNSASEPSDPLPGPTSTPDPSLSPRPSASASPSPSATPSPRPTSSAPVTSTAPTATPAPASVPISVARSAPSGTRVTINGVALTSSGFHDGGGYLADDTDGIAVLVSGTRFERGERLQVTGEVGDRYHQWTIRADAADVSRMGSGVDPAAPPVATGDVDEEEEAELVRVTGRIIGSPTKLSSGLAYEVDDGTGAVRVLVLDASGIDTSAWERDAELELRGVVGQRDSSGTGTSGYRVQPRDPADIVRLDPPSSPSAAPSPSPSRSPSPTPAPSRPGTTPTPTPDAALPLITIAAAREEESGAAARIRGVVTAGRGQLVDDGGAVIQDATGGMLLRLEEDAAALAPGAFVEATGERSTRAGMATLRVDALSELGEQPQPDPARLTTGGLEERHEAQVVVVRGLVTSAVRSYSTGSVSFDVDDGSGPARIFAFGTTGITADAVARGSWVEVVGVLGQETSGDLPLEGYRVWPRGPQDVRVVAPAITPEEEAESGDTDGDGDVDGEDAGGTPGGSGDTGDEQDLGGAVEANGAPAAARATLVVGAWPELGLAGVLWDGDLVVGISDAGDAAGMVAESVAVPPAVVELEGATRPAALGPFNGLALELGPETPIRRLAAPALPPATVLPSGDALVWGRVAGSVSDTHPAPTLFTREATVELEYACDTAEASRVWPLAGGTAVVADGLLGRTDDGAVRVVVPCGGLRLSPAVGGPARPGEQGHADAPPAMAPTESARELPAPLLPAAGLGTTLLGVLGTLAWRLGTVQRVVEAYRAAAERRQQDRLASGEGLHDPG